VLYFERIAPLGKGRDERTERGSPAFHDRPWENTRIHGLGQPSSMGVGSPEDGQDQPRRTPQNSFGFKFSPSNIDVNAKIESTHSPARAATGRARFPAGAVGRVCNVRRKGDEGRNGGGWEIAGDGQHGRV